MRQKCWDEYTNEWIVSGCMVYRLQRKRLHTKYTSIWTEFSRVALGNVLQSLCVLKPNAQTKFEVSEPKV